MKIHEQIRSLRRERRMTQEQLAEAMNVSAAAVSKWESGQSVPELNMMVQLADFFEVSLDALVGFELRTRRKTELVEDISRLTAAKKYDEVLPVTEEALSRYPNDFQVVLCCAQAYRALGMERQQHKALRQALDLFDRALGLHSQSTDARCSREELLRAKGVCHSCLGEHEAAMRWYEQSNVLGVNDQHIAGALVELKQYDKALPLISGQMYKGVTTHFHSVMDAAICLMATGHADEAEEVVAWGLDVIRNLEVTRGSYVLKMRALLCIASAMAAARQEKTEAAKDFLSRALRWARRYDEQPDPGVGSVKFCYMASRDSSFTDNVGETAMQGVKNLLRRMMDTHGMAEAEQLLREIHN